MLRMDRFDRQAVLDQRRDPAVERRPPFFRQAQMIPRFLSSLDPFPIDLYGVPKMMFLPAIGFRFAKIADEGKTPQFGAQITLKPCTGPRALPDFLLTFGDVLTVPIPGADEIWFLAPDFQVVFNQAVHRGRRHMQFPSDLPRRVVHRDAFVDVKNAVIVEPAHFQPRFL